MPTGDIKKKVLVIEDIDSLWLKLFIEQVLLPLDYEIYVLNYKRKPRYDDFLRKNGIKYIDSKYKDTAISRIPKISSICHWLSHKEQIQKRYRFDKVVVISVTLRKMICALCGISDSNDIFLYFTGSDVFRSNFIHMFILSRTIANTNATIVCGGEKLKEKCKKSIKSMKDVKVIHFASDTFDRLDYVRDKYDSKTCRNKLHIPQRKVTICVGYNAWKSQQHIKVIDALARLSEVEKGKIVLLLPMTYCKRKHYISSVTKRAKKANIDYVLFDIYLDETEIYMLRIATDIFINAQTTDSLSGSVLEAFYAGSYILSGEWLRYPDLENEGIRYHHFRKFNDIKNNIRYLLKEKSMLKKNSEEINKLENKIKTIFSKDVFYTEWKKLLLEKGTGK